MGVTILHGDCRDILPTLADASIDAVITDPPYELGFMGKRWDGTGIAYDVTLWRECLRVLKPGGHLLAFGGTRTWHRLACAIEDAGFDLRDTVTWIYGSGFPKSLDVSKAIDKAVGAQREVVGVYQSPENTTGFKGQSGRGVYAADQRIDGEPRLVTAPATDAARQWAGWGTALKPSSEPIIVARKPLAGTVAATVLAYGTGALNIDACRVGTSDDTGRTHTTALGVMNDDGWKPKAQVSEPHLAGRWPSNVVFSHAPECGEDDVAPCVEGCPVAELDAQSGVRPPSSRIARHDYVSPRGTYSNGLDMREGHRLGFNDSGGVSRFFPIFRYQAKAPSKERPKVDGVSHPTVKPLALMRWLVRLVTPPGGLVLDPFAGSGTTGEAAALERFDCVMIESEAAYLPLINVRMDQQWG